MEWKNINSINDLDELVKLSETLPVLIFKHSTRCSVSRFALKDLENKWTGSDSEKIICFFLDLLAHREISNEIEARFDVRHQSPQILIIKNGKCIFSESHSDISRDIILDQLK
ncbi:bacillithiol system redox-active protein YtxJ [soil metagenome]